MARPLDVYHTTDTSVVALQCANRLRSGSGIGDPQRRIDYILSGFEVVIILDGRMERDGLRSQESSVGVSLNTEPEYDGGCAFAISLGQRDVAGSPNHRIVQDEKTYYFKNGAARFLWKVLPDRTDKANAVWAGDPE